MRRAFRQAAFSLLLGAAPALAQELRLEEVLDSVNRSYPPLLSALLERELAEGERLSAQGKFDLRLRAGADTDRFGFYENTLGFAGMEQHTAYQGLSMFGGWRLGSGSIPSNECKQQTRSGGEWSGGMKLPLLRGRAIDERRADLRKSELGIGLAVLSAEQQRLVIRQMAARRYWDWAASGRRLSIANRLLEVASQRVEQIEEAVRLGQLAAVEIAENRRMVLQRQSLVVEAERLLQQSAIELSLFLRDAQGRPVTAEASRLPSRFPLLLDLEPAQILRDVQAARNRRPELARIRAQMDQNKVDLDLAANQRLPAIDLGFGFSAESGTSPAVKRGPNELKGYLSFELPFQRREAAGKQQAAEVKLKQLRLREGFLEDTISTEVRTAAAALRAAYQRAAVLRDEVEVARQLEEAEKEKYDLGDSTLFMINLREQAAADAALRELAALAEYFQAKAMYEMAIAGDMI